MVVGAGLLVTAAFARPAAAAVVVEEGTTVTLTDRADAAQARADAARARAAWLAAQGGWAWKTGLVQGASRDAARCQADADAIRAEAYGPVVAPVPSPELADAQARLAELRFQGGWAWKTGAIDRAEADVRALSGPEVVLMGVNEPVPATATKPVERTWEPVYR
jgi:hypothetical protein